jgi:RNA polymerase sigma factor (sigma-70 family)
MHAHDRELVAQAVAGDAEAFSSLYSRYHPLVYRFSLSMTSCASTAEDVTQDVFTGLLGHLARFDPARAGLGSYLFGIVRNLARQRRRRDARLLPLSHLDTDALTALHDDPRAILEGRESAATVRRVVNGLPARLRAPLLLCDVHDLRYVDAATVLGTTTGSVRYRLREGRSLARKRLIKNFRTVPGAGGNHLHGLQPVRHPRRLFARDPGQ